MAAERKIKATVELEGEAKFKKAITDSAKSMKVLDSEMKVAKAAFKASGDAQQFAADKARILREKIEEQEKAVKAAEQAVKQLTADGVEKNAAAMQQWQTKLNTAKAALLGMQGELNRAESELSDQGAAFDDAAGAATDYGDTLEKIARGVDFSNMMTVLGNVKDRISGLFNAAKQAATAVWQLEMGGAQWADDLATKASVYGIDVETLQSWDYASRFIDTSVDDIIKARQKLTRGLDEPTEDFMKSLNALNVPNLDTATGEMREADAVLWDIIDGLGRIDSPTRRDQIAMELLGKSAQELNPIIEAGSAAYLELAEKGREYAVVSEENVGKLGALDDAQQEMNARIEATAHNLEAELAPAFTTITEGVSTALGQFNEFLETEEGQNALSTVKDSAQSFADWLTSVDFKTAMEDGKALISDVAGAINDITTAIHDLTHPWETFQTRIQEFANLFGSPESQVKGTPVESEFLAEYGISNRSNGFGGATGGGGTSSGGAGRYTPVQDLIDAASAGAGEAEAAAGALGGSFSAGMAQGIDESAADVSTSAGNMAQGATDAVAGALDIHSPSGVARTQGQNFAIGFANGIYDRSGDAIRAALYLANSVNAIIRSALMIHSPSQVAEELGGYFGEGFALGIEDSVSSVEAAVGRMAAATGRPVASAASSATPAGASKGMVHITLVMDSRTVAEAVTPYVNTEIGLLSERR